ncbi:MAG TPA: formate dehydrogenase accessory protein FdhE [Gallionellaceae bacterium]
MSTTTILEPGQIEATAGDIPALLTPPADLFASRARRLRQLASGHSLADYLHFIARLADAQHAALRSISAPLPAAAFLARCSEHQMPPLAPAGWRRDPAWLQVLDELVKTMMTDAPAPARTALQGLTDKGHDWAEAQADLLLGGNFDGLDMACAPLIGAALQVYWTHLSRSLRPEQVALPEQPNLCPVCGSHPVASVVRIGGNVSGLRYLQCTLCSSEWHVVRAKCSNCDNTRDISYYNIEADAGVVRAESCPECQSYLKVVHMDKDPHAEACADDLASFALDWLMGEQGLGRNGINLLMLHGADGGA